MKTILWACTPRWFEIAESSLPDTEMRGRRIPQRGFRPAKPALVIYEWRLPGFGAMLREPLHRIQQGRLA
ncbi:hypothetical protein D9X30_3140 [Cupriavidus sp. U2]|nr:hypothetical protein D9X30_3140 [Cupriavidus sp. U2]